MSNMSEESPCKRIRLSEDDTANLNKAELLDLVKKQEEYIADLETKLESAASASNGEGEDKTRQLKSARREQLLVMRLTTKEQELHELANQLADKNQNASTANLRSALVDPALNLLVQRMRKELEDKTKGLDQAREDMAAWKFTADSQTGKRLMARCRTLIQENQELGKQVSQGKIAQVEAELALQKEINEELKNSQDEMYEMVLQLNDEGEGMQSTILALQQELKEKQLEFDRLTGGGELSGAIPESAVLPSSATDAAIRSEPEADIPMEQDSEPDRGSGYVQPDICDVPPQINEPFQSIIHALPQNTSDAQLQNIGDAYPLSVNAAQPCSGSTSEPSDQYLEPEIETGLPPEPEPMEQEEIAAQEQEGQLYPEVRTTEYFQEEETLEPKEEAVRDDFCFGTASKDTLSVDPWTNPSHYVDSPASPDMEEDERTSEGVRDEAEFRTGALSKSPLTELDYADERNISPAYGRESPERTKDFPMLGATEGAKSVDVERDEYRHFRDIREQTPGQEQQEEAGGSFREDLQFRTTAAEESSQDNTLRGDDRDVDSETSSRTEELSLNTDISTNGENHPESVTNTASNNGEARQFVDREYGREGEEEVEQSNKITLSTLVEDPSTLKAVEGDSNSLDNGSDVTDRQSDDTVTENNNGLSNPEQCTNSGLSSPLEDEIPPAVEEDYVRTDTVIKSLNSNSHQENPILEEGSKSDQTDSEEDLIIQNSVPSTNSKPEEISV